MICCFVNDGYGVFFLFNLCGKFLVDEDIILNVIVLCENCGGGLGMVVVFFFLFEVKVFF